MMAAIALSAPFAAYAQTVDINNPNINDSGFRLMICDGPDMSQSPGGNPTNLGHTYVPCDFKALMQEGQYLINVMIILGVVVAIIGFAIAGALYITGVEKNINRAKGIFPKLGIGFILMLTAWFIVSQILIWLTGSANYLTLQ